MTKAEIAGLKYEDFDLTHKTVTISRQITSNPIVPKGQGKIAEYQVVEKPPKTPNSYRTLRVPEAIMNELAVRKAQYDFRKEQMGDDYIDRGYVSCSGNGLPYATASFNTALTKLCERAGLPHLNIIVRSWMKQKKFGVSLTIISYRREYRYMIDLETRNYVDRDVKNVIKLIDRDNYAYRVVLKFQDGTKHIQQKSGFKTKKEAEEAYHSISWKEKINRVK